MNSKKAKWIRKQAKELSKDKDEQKQIVKLLKKAYMNERRK